ncbi:MAG: NupC/NupG family nucleoside CNT transporter [Acidobacteria bacterium]|nr:NupC/NupG family nucleoside CNT transporter [Acidobacteriota bacterium]
MERFTGLIGLAVIIGIAWLFSTDRRAIRPRTLLWGLGLQFLLAFVLLRFSPGIEALRWFAQKVTLLGQFADDGSRFLFGSLMDEQTYGVIFAIKILPTIIFISCIFSVLYYLGVMQWIVYFLARIMKRLLAISGAESLAVAANVFMGQTEAPLLVAPYIAEMTRSELLCLMVGGMATVSGAILVTFIDVLGINAAFLISASIMAAPAAIMMAKILIPETDEPKTAGRVTIEVKSDDANIIDAASRGAAKGMQLAINVAAMLIAFIALIAMANGILARLTEPLLNEALTLEQLMGWALAPLALVMGVPWSEAVQVGGLLGKKVILNEFVAYADLSRLMAEHSLGTRSEMIATYALCGFANFSSIGIQIGGIGPLAPNKKHQLARLGLRALLGGSLATCLTATIAGIIGG